jgi:hypothetical protein
MKYQIAYVVAQFHNIAWPPPSLGILTRQLAHQRRRFLHGILGGHMLLVRLRYCWRRLFVVAVVEPRHKFAVVHLNFEPQAHSAVHSRIDAATTRATTAKCILGVWSLEAVDYLRLGRTRITKPVTHTDRSLNLASRQSLSAEGCQRRVLAAVVARGFLQQPHCFWHCKPPE